MSLINEGISERMQGQLNDLNKFNREKYEDRKMIIELLISIDETLKEIKDVLKK